MLHEAGGPPLPGGDVPGGVADIGDAATLAEVRGWKQAAKAAEQDRPLR
ncbi:MAG: hypothetical protein QM733_14500 [Ilumatobacteraceae bacterium]